jgi:arginyl-tRNA synthetase
MVAWQDFGNNESPESSGIKGDHLVGKYYVKFDVEYKKEVAALIASGASKDDAEKKSNIFKRAQEMLLKWEAKDEEVIKLWTMMNGWVYKGFEKTYLRLGVDFDKNYYESNTYLLGKEIVETGLKNNVFFKKDDGSVWIDLTEEGLDEKIVLRSDGTAVYITQDIGTAVLRHKDFDFSHMVYTVANEQDYHFKVLFKILEKLGYNWAKDCYHLSYGMVDLPSGKMKSREGNVVDADDLMSEMVNEAKIISQDLGKIQDLSLSQANNLYETVGLGALKYFMLKVDPKKRMLFDPKESIDFNGNTGPFIQYTYARISSLVRKNKTDLILSNDILISNKEKELIKILLEFPKNIQDAANLYSPAILANYIYEIVKEFNSYYQSTTILNAESDSIISFRISLSKKIAEVIKKSMDLLGINVPEKM